MSEWICIDCVAECENEAHSWVKAERITRDDGSEAWLVGGPENPDGDDAFDGWLT